MVPPETPGMTSAEPMHNPLRDSTPAFFKESGPGLAQNASFHVN